MRVYYPTTVQWIIDSSGGTLIAGQPDRRVLTITTDSRDVGEENLFIPLLGDKFDGHDFIEPLVKEGRIVAFLTIKEEFEKIAYQEKIAAILCDDTLKALGSIASHHRSKMNPVMIGITGTNGKTTTKELLNSVLRKKYNCHKNEKNYNNEIGVPFTLLGLSREHEVAIIEMGMNHSGELNRLSLMTKPDIVIVTNIGEGHLEFFNDVKGVALAKSEIIDGMKENALVLLNRDMAYYDMLYEKAIARGLNVKNYGLSENAEMRPEAYRVYRDRIEIVRKGVTFSIPLFGVHNVYNALAAILASEELGLEPRLIQEALSDFKNIEMRSRLIDGDFIIIDDTYNSNPLSSRYALISASMIFPDNRKIAVLSDMKELGNLSEAYHREVGRIAYEYGFDLLCVWGEMAVAMAEGAQLAGMDDKNVLYFKCKKKLIDFVVGCVKPNDVILIKGSRSMKMEEVVDAVIH
ncbi:MAG: UDP-N-acetylmuramoyl-tripeptide--D-alanyl-D-alanine ligase [Spirochaetota bacterium]|nr:UDP-N-acetylmuramoyl-tripeptide--D-alanyl-D-alanine ligase [Spirochaetota bacterium]